MLLAKRDFQSLHCVEAPVGQVVGRSLVDLQEWQFNPIPRQPKGFTLVQNHRHPSSQSWQLIHSRLRLFFSPNSGNFAATSRSHCFYKENIVYESFTGRNQTHSLVRTAFASCNLRRTRSRSEPRASPKSGAYLFTRRNSRPDTQFSRLGRQGAN